MSSKVTPTSAPSRFHLPHLTRTDVVLTCCSAIVEAAGLAYFIHRRGWFRA